MNVTIFRAVALIFLILLSCAQQTADKAQADDCPMKNFSKTIGPYQIKAEYASCEPAWKSKLTIATGDKVVCVTDSIMEFEFNEHAWPEHNKISAHEDQLLLEVNDRPFSNYILCLTFSNEKLIRTERFHLFEHEPKDFDNDGLLEYAGFPLTIEGYTNDSTYYNPIYYVEKGPNGFSVDTALTRQVNIKLYGEFSGMKSTGKVYKKAPDDTVRKFLNRKQI